MGLSAEEVRKLAELAQIDLSPDELSMMASQLDIILDSVAQVSQVASDDVIGTSHPVPVTNVFRPDELAQSWPADQMLASAPQTEEGMFKVPRILGDL